MSNAEAQIERLVKSLTKKNFKTVSQELHQLTNLYGRDAQFHLISSLVSHVNTGGKDQHAQTQLLSQELKTLTLQENCSTCLCAVLESSDSHAKGNFPVEYVANLGNKLSLPTGHQALFGLALMQSSNPDISKSATSYLRAILPLLIKDVDRNADEVMLQKVVLYLLADNPEGSVDEAGMALLLKLKTAFPANAPPSLLSPLLHKLESITPTSRAFSDELQKKIRNSMNISQMIYELGHGCIASPASANTLIAQLDKSTLTPKKIAGVLGMMAHTPSGLEDSLTLQTDATENTVWDKRASDATLPATWNFDNFVKAINSAVPKFDWKATFASLDYPGFSLRSLAGLGFLLNAWKCCSQDPLPIDALFGLWANKVGQYSVMSLIFDPANVSTPEVTAVTAACSRRLKLDGVRGIDITEGAFTPWFCLDLVAALMSCSESEVYTKVIQIVGNAAKTRPEIVALAVASSTPGTLWVACQEATVHSLTPRLIQTAQLEPILLQKLFAVRPASVVGGLSRHYNSLYNATGDTSAVHPILDLLKSIKCLEEVLKHPTSAFVFDLAVVAAHREFLNLEKWAKSHLEKNAASYLPTCIAYLKDRLGRPDASDRKVHLQTLLASLDEASQRDVMSGKSITTELNALSLADNLQFNVANGVPVDGSSTDISSSELGTATFSKAIDDEANAYFKSIYSGEMTIDQVVAMLAAFKNSQDPKQMDVFNCMIRNLFDEHRFFPQYPDKELRITGLLFGAFVQHKLINFTPLGMALRHVLDALRKEPGNKMHQFGLCALGQFKDRLHEWPQYCATICRIAHFNAFTPELKAACQAGQKGQAPLDISNTGLPSLDSPSFTPGIAPPSPGQSQSIFSQNNLDTLLARHVDHREPSTAVQDKIHFIFNNIAENNVETKAQDLRKLIGKEHFPWMAQYFVVKRASLEPNYHTLYMTFLSLLDMPFLIKAILEETYRNIKLLLKSPKIASSSQERSLLKNLGAWLGMLTLGRNKPILFKDVAIKELVLRAFEMGTKNLLYVIPFVAKVLEACARSTVFRPPNPWVMAILGVLKELHQQPLKVNLKFEIEVLCRKMSISIDDIPASNRIPEILERQKRQSQLQTPPMMPGTPSRGRLPSEAGDKVEAATALQRLNAFPLLSTSAVSSIGPYITISSSIQLFQQQPSLEPTVQMAVERAIQDIISPVVDRAIKIACVSSHKLTTKDFALEGDENKLRKSAHTMTQHLAGSLAMVFCKDPLRASIGSHLRAFLVSALNSDGKAQQQYAAMVDQAVSVVPVDNLDLACALIEKTAIERAVAECDEGLADDYRERHRWREMRTQQPFVDSQHYYAPGVSNLPAALRPKFGGLDPMQLSLYEHFDRFSSVAATAPAQPSHAQQQLLAQQQGPPVPANTKDGLAGQPQVKVADVQQAWERILTYLAEVEKAAPHYVGREFVSLNNTTDLHLWMNGIQEVVAQFPTRDLVNRLCHKVLVLLIDADNKILMDWSLVLLQHMQEMYKLEFAKELTKVYILLENERKFNPQLVTRLLHARLLEPADIDSFLVKLLDSGKSNVRVVSFVEEILHRCLLVEPRVPHLTPTEFIQTIDLLTKVAAHTKPPREVQIALVDAINQLRKAILKDMSSARSVAVKEDPEDPPGLRESVGSLFEEWIRLVNQPQKNDKAAIVFISRLMQQGMLKTDDISSRFFRLCTDYAVMLCYGGRPAGEQDTSVPQSVTNYHGVDAFGKLIVVLVKHFKESTRVALLTKVLSTVANVLTRDYEVLGLRFNQRPYFRILANLLLDVQIPDESVNFQMLTNWANTLHVLRPAVVPGFIFSWLELVSHRNFMAKLLLCKAQQPKPWQLLQRLLADLLTYMGPFLSSPEISEPTRALYKGTLRVMLVLLHDFPEFLCEFHQSLCDVTPQNCIQMRNLILSAFPRTMRLPDPFTPNLKVDLLPEINQPPRIMSQYTAILESSDLRVDTHNYLMTRSPSTFLVGLRARFLNPSNGDSPPTYNVPLINAFVLDVGIKAIEMVKTSSEMTITRGPPMEIFQHLASELDPEGRYSFFNAIANQLRYPNSHTHYFSCVILFLFAEAEKEVVKEQITRVLLERLIVNRPHPWGLLITFIELIKNNAYNFWSYSFVRCAPEIERLFESVARSCMYNQRAQPPHPAAPAQVEGVGRDVAAES